MVPTFPPCQKAAAPRRSRIWFSPGALANNVAPRDPREQTQKEALKPILAPFIAWEQIVFHFLRGKPPPQPPQKRKPKNNTIRKNRSPERGAEGIFHSKEEETGGHAPSEKRMVPTEGI